MKTETNSNRNRYIILACVIIFALLVVVAVVRGNAAPPLGCAARYGGAGQYAHTGYTSACQHAAAYGKPDPKHHLAVGQCHE